MGGAVTHFEVIGRDATMLRSFYGDLFEWNIDSDNPTNYGIVAREENLNPAGIGIGGGIGGGGGEDDGQAGHVTFYVEVPDVEAALTKAVAIGGSREMGPAKVNEHLEIGMLRDPEGHLVGVIKSTT
ncbi:MAG: VOC family protein [Acidimicrobiales bacterium]